MLLIYISNFLIHILIITFIFSISYLKNKHMIKLVLIITYLFDNIKLIFILKSYIIYLNISNFCLKFLYITKPV